uniref:YTH domain-containing protein n=1 Tax=Caenorhabditis tropicalis TaxID=1561998 RepID=A0A1I7TRM8_9PELO
MSAKPEQAQAPATVSNADPAPAHSHPLQHQPHPPNYQQGQVVYQQPYQQVNYQPQGPQVWNQPPQATVHYVQYAPQPEAGNFQENKVQSYNHYGTVHFTQPMDNGEMMMRQQQNAFVPQQYVQQPQWYPAGQQQPAQFVPSYATPFNVANDPTYHPNHPMNRAHREDFQGDNSSGYMQFVPFVAPIGMMESQAHASASYTANWVSSTSSIPPEMKDEPESDNISQYDSQRPTSQLNGDNWTDQEDHLSPSTAQPSFHMPRQMPYVEKDKSPSQSTTKTSKKGDRGDGKRELTFDERLEKARMQKSRVENQGGNGVANQSMMPAQFGQPVNYSGYMRQEGYNGNNHMNNRGFYFNGNTSGAFFAGDPQLQAYQHQARYARGNAVNAQTERDTNTKRDNNYSNRFDNNQFNSSYNHQGTSDSFRQYRGRGGRGGFRGGFNQPPLQPILSPAGPPNPYAGAPIHPQMLVNAFQNAHIGPAGVPRLPLLPGPFGIPRQLQDIKFHNTWLDASSCPMPLAAVMNMDTRFGRGGVALPFRGRGRGNFRGGFRGGFGNGRVETPNAPVTSDPVESSEKKEEEEKNEKEESPTEPVEKKETEETSE